MPLSDQLYATCASGLQNLLATELKALGAPNVNTAGAGVRFGGGLEVAYKACLWSRIANRVLLPIGSGDADSPENLYELIKSLDWSAHLAKDGSLAVDFFSAQSVITHTQYGALKAKDAVVDQFRENTGQRPDVDRDTPDVRINIYLHKNRARVALDLSGSSLHRRGYREQAGPAPLKENLAAAMLAQCDWPALAAQSQPFADPMCGSGTLAIEAAMMACNVAPGLLRTYYGFNRWLGHDAALWNSVKAEAQASKVDAPCEIFASDSDQRAVELAKQNATIAGVDSVINFKHQDIRHGAVQLQSTGLLLSNPPYGERLSTDADFYKELGKALSSYYAGWSYGLFTAQQAPFKNARLPSERVLTVRNGGIDCALYSGVVPGKSRKQLAWGSAEGGVESAAENSAWSGKQTGMEMRTESGIELGEGVDAEPVDRTSATGKSVWPERHAEPNNSLSSVAATEIVRSSHQAVTSHQSAIDSQPFANRVRKNHKHLRSWVKRENINAYRVYDADLPEFAVAIDIYNCDQRHVVVQEYQAPITVNTVVAEQRMEAILSALPELLAVQPDRVHVKVREKQTERSQYEKHNRNGVTALLEEQGGMYELNFSDYLDTGLFLDHRPLRRHIQQTSKGKRVLNLFAYTGSLSVAAALGGASSSVSVDLSKRYCEWAQRNLQRNQCDAGRHEVVREDVAGWLDHQLDQQSGQRVGGQSSELSDRQQGSLSGAKAMQQFDLIILDPPTFSNSTGIDADWNVQRDHENCIRKCMQLLTDDGLLVFSNNYRRFKLSENLTASGPENPYKVRDKTHWSLDKDFQRNSRIHYCWFIQHA